MTESIETFVSRLHQEGIQAGQAEAEKIRAQARREAEHILQDARQQAQRILVQAQDQAASALEKGRNELQLAARDAILTLRDKIKQILQAILAGTVKQHLDDSNFLISLLRDIILQYAHEEHENIRDIKINLTPDQHKKLIEWAIDETHRAALDSVLQKKINIDLKGTLKQAGFEYQVDGATIEVTVESVVAILMRFVSPGLNQLLDQVGKNLRQ